MPVSRARARKHLHTASCCLYATPSFSRTASTSSAMSGSAQALSLRFAKVLGRPQPISNVVHAYSVALIEDDEALPPPGAEVAKVMPSPLKPLPSPAPHKLRSVARDTRTTFSRGAAVTCRGEQRRRKEEEENVHTGARLIAVRYNRERRNKNQFVCRGTRQARTAREF